MPHRLRRLSHDRIAGKTLFPFSLPVPYKIPGQDPLPQSDSTSGSTAASRRWTIVAAVLLLAALYLVVICTTRGAFFSPLALVVVAAIGLAALLLQLRLRRDLQPVRAPLWLNLLALVLAVGAVFADILRLNPLVLLSAALGAVVCFAISGIVVLNALRKKRA
jgi:peptidoglycan/LPS O-acetylase OafA/YrhL